MSGESNTVAEEQSRKLQDVFLEGWKTYEFLEDTSLEFNGPDFQGKVVMAMEDFELATRIVSQTQMFSANEIVDEISTESLQYLLLPFFLGKLALKRNEQERADVLRVADIYFRDFIRRCHEYDLCDLPRHFERNSQEEKDQTPNNSTMDAVEQLVAAATSRNNKIAQFKRKKELDEYIKKLKDVVRNHTADDELKRDFFIKLIKRSIMEAVEELDSITLEKGIVEMRKARLAEFGTTKLDDAGGITQWDLPQQSLTNKPQCSRGSGRHPHQLTRSKPKPLQPFIITRDAAQKAVFGMGYPSLPVMTVDEFYQQRVDEGVFPDEEKTAQMNKAQALAAAQDPTETEEQEKAAIEEQLESDDPEYLRRMRNMDEYKDVVRRGDGNRYNRS